MIEAIKIWNEPNNLSHWNFNKDPQWRIFSQMALLAVHAIREEAPELPIVLGGISPIDPDFMHLLKQTGLVDEMDAVAVHGFPLDWNHWRIDEWPEKIRLIEKIANRPVWVTEVGVSSFGADEVQAWGLRRSMELLRGVSPRIFWYSLLDLPPTWEATTRHRESEGSSYYRHFHMGLIRADGTIKPSLQEFDPALGICQWFHFEDPRIYFAIDWLQKLKVEKLRTGISWADWVRPDALRWFDVQMRLIEPFDTTLTLCFTPPSRGVEACYTSPPRKPAEFAEFAKQVVRRYVMDRCHLGDDHPAPRGDKNSWLQSSF